MSNDLMFGSAKNDWETPSWLFKELDEEFHFTLDAAASSKNALCDWYYSEHNYVLGHAEIRFIKGRLNPIDLKGSIREAYFSWLCNQIDLDKDVVSYNEAFALLEKLPFIFYDPRDITWNERALSLRDSFIIEHSDAFIYEECRLLRERPISTLELLFLLAKTLAHTPWDFKVAFYELWCNLGLDAYDDPGFNGLDIYQIIHVWRNRMYGRLGLGSCFPLSEEVIFHDGGLIDQRNLSLSEQLKTYALVNDYWQLK